MENYVDVSMQLRKELEALPRDYTQTMATRNWDVVYHMVTNFNIGRFLIFIDNYYKGIPDKIRIAKFGIDGPATTAILYYDGNLITYVVDDTRYPTDGYYTFFGYNIAIKERNLDDGDEGTIDYNLITLDDKEISILGIWVGFKN
jgi:hypothetical protein